MMTLFISYSNRDRAFVDQLRQVLSKMGHQSICDDDLQAAGKDWRKTIGEIIDRQDVLVAVLSMGALKSGSVQEELKLADQLGKPIMPITLLDEQLAARLTVPTLQPIPYYEGEGWTTLEDRLRTALHEVTKLPSYRKTQSVPVLQLTLDEWIMRHADDTQTLLRLDGFFTALYAYVMLGIPDSAYHQAVGIADNPELIAQSLTMLLDTAPEEEANLLRQEQAVIEQLLRGERYALAQRRVDSIASQLETLLADGRKPPGDVLRVLRTHGASGY